MIRFYEDYSLKNHNTFGVEAKARFYFEFTEPADLEIFLRSNEGWRDEALLLLGEGSNVLFRDDFNGLVICPKVPGLALVHEDRQNVWVEAGAGENWDEFVEYCVFQGFGGPENLSHIPGAVGAAPVQNIGAYGREVGELVERVKGFNLQTMQMEEYSGEECRFDYRDSIFKQELKGKFVITSVIFRLEKFPEFNLTYGSLGEKVKELGETSLYNIRKAVIAIRSAKLPDVKELGSAGSFFKNPVVDEAVALHLQQKFPDMPVYPAGASRRKLAAGWLIEQAGWKGYREGDAGVHEKQALVLVNYGAATGKQIFELSEKIRSSVADKFGIELEREVNCL